MIHYLRWVVQNRPFADRTAPFCSGLECREINSLIRWKTQSHHRDDVFIDVHHHAVRHYACKNGTFVRRATSNLPNTVVSSGISSIKHFRSVSPMWKYNAVVYSTTNAKINNATVFFVLTMFGVGKFLMHMRTQWQNTQTRQRQMSKKKKTKKTFNEVGSVRF